MLLHCLRGAGTTQCGTSNTAWRSAILYECNPSLTRDYEDFFGDSFLTANFSQMTVAALVTSLNPSINARQTTGTDSEEVSPPEGNPVLGHPSLPDMLQHDGTPSKPTLLRISVLIPAASADPTWPAAVPLPAAPRGNVPCSSVHNWPISWRCILQHSALHTAFMECLFLGLLMMTAADHLSFGA